MYRKGEVIIILLATIILVTVLQLVVLGAVIFLDNRDPAKTVTWLFILGTLPVIGAVLYLMFGRTLRRHQVAKRSQIRLEHIVKHQQEKFTSDDVLLGDEARQKKKLARLLLNDSMAPLSFNNKVRVLTNGEQTFKAIFTALEAAKSHIHLEYYIFKDDEVGKDVIKILSRKATQGVKVRVLVDGWGSRSIAKPLKDLRQAGVETAWFSPVRFPFLSSRLNLRNHRKIVIIDGKVGFLGGLNIGDEYLSRSNKYGFWRDTFVELQGASVYSLQDVFLNDWYFATKENIKEHGYYPKLEKMGSQLTQIAASGPDSSWESILQVFFTAMTSAEKRIYIETPYFIPDESTLMALKTAALSGLDVRIIFQGLPDHKITYWASQSYFAELLAAGVRIYHYRKGLLHAKILIVDGEIGSVGSTNFDVRSFRLNFEISAFIYQQDFARRLEEDFYQDLADSEEIEYTQFIKRPMYVRIKESGARLLSPLL